MNNQESDSKDISFYINNIDDNSNKVLEKYLNYLSVTNTNNHEEIKKKHDLCIEEANIFFNSLEEICKFICEKNPSIGSNCKKVLDERKKFNISNVHTSVGLCQGYFENALYSF